MKFLMTDIMRGDIWLTDLDQTSGHEINKTRPCVIIQNDTGNKQSSLTIIAPITSRNIENLYPIEVFLSERTMGLEKDSKILLDQIRAVDKKRLIKKLGKVSNEVIPKINEALKISLGL